MRMWKRILCLALVATSATLLAAELPRLLAFGSSDSCEWCRLLERRVFSSGAWHNWATGHVEFVRVDLPRGDGVLAPEERARNNALADRLDVKGIPTFVLLAAESDTELGRVKVPDSARGLGRDMTPEAFIAALDEKLGRDKRGPSHRAERPSLWRVYRFIPVVLLLGFAAWLLVDKSRLPLALRGLNKMLGTRMTVASTSIAAVPPWKRLLAFVLVVVAFLIVVL